jgi:hypothetical protein
MGVIWVLLLAGCTSSGPKTIPRDRFDYNKAVSDSWKEQTLLNIVKLRYADMPLFMEVASIVSGYTLESEVNLGGNIVFTGTDSDLLSLGASGKYIDRPTITYAPVTGQKFNKSFMTPIPPSAILFLMQSGWPIDVIFPITVDTVNGLRSHIAGGKDARKGDPDYYKVIALLRKIQKSGALGMRVIQKKDLKESTVMFFHQKNISPEIEQAFEALNLLLGLEKGDREMTISYGFIPRTDDEIALLTRSILQIMVEMAKQIDVPAVHIAEGRTGGRIANHRDLNQDQVKLITVAQSVDRPEHAFTAVKYKEHWFSIDDRDFESKRSFAVLMLLFSLTESSGKEGLPLVTIPAG